MNVPPPKRKGPASKLTPTQQVEAWAWFQAKRHLGTYKAKAKEFGITAKNLHDVIRNMRRRANDYRS